jgi:hypothetical protein
LLPGARDHRCVSDAQYVVAANHKFVEVAIDYAVTDPCPNTSGLTVSSNEAPVDDKVPEWTVVDAHHVELRAERLGDGNGRIHTITVTCTNATNKKSSTQTVTGRCFTIRASKTAIDPGAR